VLATPSSVYMGASVTLIATVNSTNGSGPAPTGTVTFLVNGIPLLNYPLSNNAASVTFSTATLPPGQLSITAQYNGDANYFASSSQPAPLALTATPTVQMTATPSTVGQGQPLLFTVTVPPVNGGPLPTGSITLSNNYVKVGTFPLSGGKMSKSVTATGVGNDQAMATYSGDANYLTAQASVSYTVLPAAAVTLAVSPSSLIQGQSATLLATVTSTGYGPTPTGTVTFHIPGHVIATSTLNSNGAASVTASTSTVPPGTYLVSATYSGDSSDGPATSQPVTVVVQSQ